ncbi:uncharacterized protein LOC143300794 isoform X2 [Babylonia areolata]|uniref:uncharacterized protein LOC143300794 isoform X2 n=1 Tax=Babylonia areolata TaxID=304850 RepID=UPI003FD0890C
MRPLQQLCRFVFTPLRTRMTWYAVPVVGICLLASITCHSTSVSNASSTASNSFDLLTYLPSAWNRFCSVQYDVDPDVNATVSCRVTPQFPVLWRLADLRNSLNVTFVESAKLEIAVRIECEAEGAISLPFPYRSPGLVKLTILNCRLLDKWADINTTAEHLGDWLRVMDIQSCIWLNDPTKLQHLLRNIKTISSHYDCAQDSTLVSHIYRNISNADLCETVYPPIFQLLNLTYPMDIGRLLGSEELFDMFLEHSKEKGGFSEECALQLEPLRSIHFDLSESVPDPPTSIPADSSSDKPGRDVLDTFIQLIRVHSECRFERLQLLDESHSSLLNRKYFEYLVKNTVFPQLRVLNFSYTGLTEVPLEIREWRRYFKGSKLEIIDLSNNYIQDIGYIPPDINTHGVSTVLNVNFNRISKLSLEMLETWALVPDFQLDIRNNPIDCVCDIKDLIKQLRNETRFADPTMRRYKQQILNLICASPLELAGRSVSMLTVGDLQCPVVERGSADTKTTIGVLVVVVAVLLVLLALAVRYRKEVRILMYTRVHILIPCGFPKSPLASVPEKTYDAFVAYAHQDSEWVLGSLLKRLEHPSGNPKGRRPCKLCIHQRDFVVGKPIIDNIVDSIAASRHTIVVLTNSFVKSGWAMEELQQAYHQSLEERRRHLVMVVLENIEHSSMGAVLRRCCKTFTYLHVSDPLFWDRLLYSIQVGDHRNGKGSNQSQDSAPSTEDSPDADSNADNQQQNKESDAIETEQFAGESKRNTEINKLVLFTESLRTVSVDGE